jgi:large subunit ribosomal protein L16
MGKGKGFVDHWVCKVKPGLMLCEINITPTSLGIKALDLAQIKLPFATRVIFN